MFLEAARGAHARGRALAVAETAVGPFAADDRFDRLLQHATFTIPNFHEGYCLDDNARALVLTVLLEEIGQDTPEIQRAATTYAAFLNYAFDDRPAATSAIF